MRRLLCFLLLATPSVASAQSNRADSLAVLAFADSALAVISRNDFAALANMMLPEAMTFATQAGRSGVSIRPSTRAQMGAVTSTVKFLERGYRGEAKVDGPIAMVWLPYDFHLDGKWSHCGVDIFTLIKGSDGWKIASLVYTASQPPACARHPAGPPRP
jgi:hypothetical protein